MTTFASAMAILTPSKGNQVTEAIFMSIGYTESSKSSQRHVLNVESQEPLSIFIE